MTGTQSQPPGRLDDDYEMVTAKNGVLKMPVPVQMRNQEPTDTEKGFSMNSSKYNTAPASYFDRIKQSFRYKIHGVIDDHSTYDVVQKISEELCPVDFSDNFDSDEQLAVRIERDSVKFSILEMMQEQRGNTRLLTEVEENADDIDLTSLSCAERQVLLLWAAFIRRKDLLQQLLAARDCDLQLCTPDEGLSALHLAAYSGCHECVLLLLRAGAKMTHRNSYSPLHCAALSASVPCVTMLLNHGARVDSRSQDLTNDKPQDTPLHCAVKANSVECIRQLLQAGANPSAVGQGGLTPLHVAGDLSYLGCMRAILDHGALMMRGSFDVNQVTQDGRGYTTMHIVTEDQFADGISLLKEYNASGNVKSSKGLTPLHLACREQSVECAKLLVKECNVNEQEHEGRTPLHLALGRAEAAEIAEFLIQLPGLQVNLADKYGFTALHVAAVNEQAQAAAALIRAGADLTARTDRGSTALRMVIRKVPTSLYAVEEVMDNAISLNNNMDSRDVEVKLDFKPLLSSKKRITTDLLNTFIAEGHPELMQHPLCQAFLHIKWQEVRIFYFFRLLLYFLFLCCVSLYVVAFLSDECTEAALKRLYSNESKTGNCTDVPSMVKEHGDFLITIHKGMIYLIVFEIIRKLYGLIAFCVAPTSVSIKSSLQVYCCQAENWLEWCCLLCVGLLCILERQDWHVYMGSAAVLAGWTNLMILVGQLPVFGAYVAMYTVVLKEMGKLLLAYLCMLIGFAVSFHVIFRKRSGFESFWKTLVKILVMMTGELEFNDLFEMKSDSDDEKPVPFSLRITPLSKAVNNPSDNDGENVEFFAYLIFTVFLLLVTVVLMNLLVGIAVHDIHGLRTSAVISRLQRQADLIGYIETALPNCCNVRSLFCCCWIPFLGNRRGGHRRRKTDFGVLSVKPHNLQMNSLPREIVSAAFEVAKRMNPYKAGVHKATKAKPRYKRIYSKQHSGSIYDTIIPRVHEKAKAARTASKKYLDLSDFNLDAVSTHSTDCSCKNVAEDMKELKEALAQQNELLRRLFESNDLREALRQSPNRPPPLPPPSPRLQTQM